MAQFNGMVLTTVGTNMATQAQGDKTLTFTKVELGDGTPDGDIKSLTGLKHYVLSAAITKIDDSKPNQITITATIDNSVVETGFFGREIGLYGKIGTNPEQLYAYATAGMYSDYIPDKSANIDKTNIEITIAVSSDTTVTMYGDTVLKVQSVNGIKPDTSTGNVEITSVNHATSADTLSIGSITGTFYNDNKTMTYPTVLASESGASDFHLYSLYGLTPEYSNNLSCNTSKSTNAAYKDKSYKLDYEIIEGIGDKTATTYNVLRMKPQVGGSSEQSILCVPINSTIGDKYKMYYRHDDANGSFVDGYLIDNNNLSAWLSDLSGTKTNCEDIMGDIVLKYDDNTYSYYTGKSSALPVRFGYQYNEFNEKYILNGNTQKIAMDINGTVKCDRLVLRDNTLVVSEAVRATNDRNGKPIDDTYVTYDYVKQLAYASSIPKKTSQLTNDSGFITSSAVPTKTSQLTNDSSFITSSSIPTKTSQLTNDSSFITTTQMNTAINQAIGAILAGGS